MYTHAYYFAHIFLTFKVVFSPDPQSSGKEVLHKCKWSHIFVGTSRFRANPVIFHRFKLLSLHGWQDGSFGHPRHSW